MFCCRWLHAIFWETIQIRPLEMLGIVLFRFRMLACVWAILLILVNAGALVFIGTIYGQVALLAVCSALVVMIGIHAKLGFVRLLGIGHIFWVPMLVGFALYMPDKTTEPALYYWVLCLMVFNTISLVIDTIDVVRFIRGERQPHYTW